MKRVFGESNLSWDNPVDYPVMWPYQVKGIGAGPMYCNCFILVILHGEK